MVEMGIEGSDDGWKRAVGGRGGTHKELLLRSCFVSCGFSFDRGFGFLRLTEIHTVVF